MKDKAATRLKPSSASSPNNPRQNRTPWGDVGKIREAKPRQVTYFQPAKVGIGLQRLLAETTALQMQYRNVLWNGSEPVQHKLAEVLRGHYQMLADAMDEIAELIRTRGRHCPGSLKEVKSICHVKPVEGYSLYESVSGIIAGHKVVLEATEEVLSASRIGNDHEASAIASDRNRSHKKLIREIESHEQEVTPFQFSEKVGQFIQ